MLVLATAVAANCKIDNLNVPNKEEGNEAEEVVPSAAARAAKRKGQWPYRAFRTSSIELTRPVWSKITRIFSSGYPPPVFTPMPVL